MSIYGALFSGVSGLEAQSNTLSVISDNISNVNTVGYKGSEGLFESLVTDSGGSSFSSGGVIGSAEQLVAQQGLLQSTSSPTDIAISGNGMFVVNQSTTGTGQVLYTRAGNFTQDSSGNFQNAAGYYLQAWPLDRNGLLPGAPGNLNTNSSANLDSLQTVNVDNLTGTASATTSVAIGANLESSQANFAGITTEATMDAQDSVNHGITANTIIIPTNVDSLQAGDQFTTTTGSGLTYTYTYGGFTESRSVFDSTVEGGSATVSPKTTPTTLMASGSTTPPFTIGASNSGFTTVTVAQASSGLTAGDTVTLAGNTQIIDGIPAADFNGQFIVSNVTSNGYDIQVAATAATSPVTSFAVNNSTTVIVTQVGSNLKTGDQVTLSGATPPTGSGLMASDLEGNFTVTAIDADHYSITAHNTSSGGSLSGGSGTSLTTVAGDPGSGSITSNTRLFSGNILNASDDTTPFLNGISTTDFTPAGLTFTITTPSTGTSTFTYVATSPNAQEGQFNTLNNLADAISSVSGLTAKVVNNQLYVSSINANDSISFNNGSTVGVSGPPVQSGIDWVNELGLGTVAVGTNRYSTLQGLADIVNASTGLVATVDNPQGTSDLKIGVTNALDTIQLTDAPIGSPNSGSPLAALGFTTVGGNPVSSLNGATPVAGTRTTTGALGPDYNASIAANSMAGGGVTPQFSRSIQVYDSLGTAHNLNVGFIKTDTNTWAVEVYAQPASDVISSATDPAGQVASGTIKFNGDGSLSQIGGGLISNNSANPNALTINWTNGSDPSEISVNWGTAGQPFGTPNASTIGKTDGLSQFDSAYNVNFANQNGVPVGDLTGVSIDSNGFVIASFNNGDTQKLYKIPLAQFTNPDGLQSTSGDVFSQTEESGQVNLAQAGVGGSGTISSSSLEASNVELADQLTAMIVAQRAYEANTKVISTADGLLNDLNQIIQ